MTLRYLRTSLSFLIFVSTIGFSAAQTYDNLGDVEELTDEILRMDSLFWKSYNTCDLDEFKTFFTEDLEFYHDKGGLTSTLTAFMQSVETGLCGSENWRLRREVVNGSVKVYPLNNYGAILSGEHVFYIIENDEERLDGKAKFTHVWQLKDNQWRMSRVLSYDHGPANQNATKNKIFLPDDVLTNYVGEYEGAHVGIVAITKNNGIMEIHTGQMRDKIYPESENTFFHDTRDLTFEFVSDNEGNVLKMIIREHGEIVEEAKRIK